jgi:phosphomannomutase
MRDVVLFDLDGTLTPPRRGITAKNLEKLIELSAFARVGIVTGSTLDYIKEQVDVTAFEHGVEAFPCNGTEHWLLDCGSWRSQVTPKSMMNHMGIEWRDLHIILNKLQGEFLESISDCPITGNFVSSRSSMVNWCPIGREAGVSSRTWFESFDERNNFRAGVLALLKLRLMPLRTQLVAKLGGSTSFDIYPVGWDKTYVLNHFTSEPVWFVGDRCLPDGNDFELYEKLNAFGRAFHVKDCDETPSVIDEIIVHTRHRAPF